MKDKDTQITMCIRIKPENKDWLFKAAEVEQRSASNYLNILLEKMRAQVAKQELNAGQKIKPTRGRKAS
jgi:uncharacterized protein (DUF1778 family)